MYKVAKNFFRAIFAANSKCCKILLAKAAAAAATTSEQRNSQLTFYQIKQACNCNKFTILLKSQIQWGSNLVQNL